MVVLSQRVNASRLQALSAVRRLQGQQLRRLQARSQPSRLGTAAVGAVALAGAAHVVAMSG